ncbi:hypothetical protein AwWohl_00310 [Gammaproteobacteria bacterium]|nr:hypothetical protein AwWohl_00310 [Gammaproteobacteria bacterium]
MSKLSLYKNDAFIRDCRKKLDDLVQSTQEVNAALLATEDGFQLCSVMIEDDNTQRLSAASSSLLALAVSLSAEFGLEKCKSIHIDSETGKILLSQINADGYSLVLLIQGSTNSMLGHVLYSGNTLRESIIGLLNTYSSSFDF